MVQAITFGPFRLLPAQRALFEDDRPLRLGGRALDILIALAGSAGELISKDELVARVWPKTTVEDANLRVHIAALRKALGDGHAGSRYIVTVPGRGYCFVAPVERLDEGDPSTTPSVEPYQVQSLPAPLARMIGRREAVSALAAQLPRCRFVTIVGPGGIGKTTVALAVADRLVPAYADGVRFIDLTPLGDDQLVPNVLAFVLGQPIHSENPIPALTDHLRVKQMLLVFDGCEHVTEAAAALAEEVLRAAPKLHILATSREPLRAEGEHVQRLPPLAVPSQAEGRTATQALEFPAVRLFVERASARLDTFELADADAPIVGDVCRRLDGIALAIELAAGHIDVYGLRGLAASLNERFGLLTSGRRTALPRHRTLAATLDWSYEVLPESERVLLRRLAVFAGPFTLQSASIVASTSGLEEAEVADRVGSLVAKSLITADISGETVHYRLLDTTRGYAIEKLIASGELEAFSRRHAEYYRALLERADAETETLRTAEWLARYGWRLGNVRAALDWAFSPGGDVSIGVALTAASVPLWTLESLLVECRGRVERALASVQPGSSLDARHEMRLQAALGWSLIPTKGPLPETRHAWAKALEIAESLNDTEYRLRALWGLWVHHLDSGEHQLTGRLAERFASLAGTIADQTYAAIGERIVGVSLHYNGDQTGARQCIERMLVRSVGPLHRSHMISFQLDQRVMARATLARILWLQGLPDQAMSMAQSNVEDARTLGHGLSLCYTLVEAACPVAFFTGDLAAADRWITMLLDRSAQHGLAVWHAWGRCFEAALCLQRGDVDTGVQLLRGALDAVRKIGFSRHYTAFLGALAEGMAALGQVEKALAAIDEALTRSERNEERWCLPELQRIKGGLALREGSREAATAAEGYFLQALQLARLQGSLSWELRAAMSLARLRGMENRHAEGLGGLAAVYARFTQGFETTDLKAAKSLLATLS
jgi:predicted ATPase/DNA-binding winged helix-turn-helix (wHTH) protein